MVSMKTNTYLKGHQRVMPRFIQSQLRDVFIIVTQRGTTIMVEFPEKRVCIFNAYVNDKNRKAQIRMKSELCCFDG